MAGHASCHVNNDTTLHSMYILTSHVLSYLVYLPSVSLSTEGQKSEESHLVSRISVSLASASHQLAHVHFLGVPLSYHIDLSYNIRAPIVSYVEKENGLSRRARKIITV
jgi:hypothetical protein